MKSIFIAIFCLFTLCSFAQQEIKIEDAKDHVGDSVKICSKVYGGKYLPNVKGQPTLLDFGGKFPNAPMTIVIWNEARQQFQKPPEEYYKGASVCITGRIKLFKEKPEIIVRQKSQIEEIIIDKIPGPEPG